MKALWERSVQRGGRWLSSRLLRRWLPLGDGAPVLSVTFDDVIASACDAGAAILEEYDGRGTYYVAGGLTDAFEDGKRTHTVEQLVRLRQTGHEIGCHGWSHTRYTRVSQQQLIEDLDRNESFLATLGNTNEPPRPLNFAYPFGDHGLGTQRVCSRRFSSCRIVGGGVHRHRADLNRLGSLRFYGDTLQLWRQSLDQIANGGWLVVNTHAVEADAGPYGCTPADLHELLREARRAGCEILPVDDVLRRGQLSAGIPDNGGRTGP